MSADTYMRMRESLGLKPEPATEKEAYYLEQIAGKLGIPSYEDMKQRELEQSREPNPTGEDMIRRLAEGLAEGGKRPPSGLTSGLLPND